MDNLLQQGITAYKNGHRLEARRLLTAFLQEHGNSKAGWGWFFLVCETDQGRQECLKQILRIDPHNVYALQYLEQYPPHKGPPQQPAPEDIPGEASTGGRLARTTGRFLESLQDGSFSQYIILHPWVFVMAVILIAVLCFGGLYLIPGKRNPAAIPAPATPAATATIQVTRAASPPSGQTPTADIKAGVSTVMPVTGAATPVPITTATSPTTAQTPTLAPAGMGSGGPLVVTFIDVGQGDSILIAAPDGQVGLIDGGSAGKGALAYLQSLDIQRIDLMIATHSDEEHIGGLIEVLNAMPVGKVLTSGPGEASSTYAQFVKAIAADKADYSQAVSGDMLNLGSLAFSVLSPAGNTAASANPASLALRLSYEKTTFLFMGDAGVDVEAGILADGQPVRANILKVGQAASCAASSLNFLEAVQPQVAVYSAGEEQPYGPPCEAALSALNDRGVFVFGTDAGGSISIHVAADGYSISNSSGVLFRR